MKHALPLLLALTLVTGYIDALAFIGFGHVFTANMSGNTILLGITLVQLMHPLGISEGPAGHALAIGSFALGVTGAALYLRKPQLDKHRVVALILTEAVLVLGGAAAMRRPLHAIVMLAAAAGAQTVLAVKAGVPGISTTYVSGTIVRAISDALNLEEPKHLRRGGSTGAAWLAYGSGAAAGALGFWWLQQSALLLAALAFTGLAMLAARG